MACSKIPRTSRGDVTAACLNIPVFHLLPLAFWYMHSNLLIRGSLAPGSCGWPYRQAGREHFTSSYTPLQIWVVGCGRGDAQWHGSFRSNVSSRLTDLRSSSFVLSTDAARADQMYKHAQIVKCIDILCLKHLETCQKLNTSIIGTQLKSLMNVSDINHIVAQFCVISW